VRKLGGRVKLGVIGCGVVATRDILPNLIQPQIAERGVELISVCDAVESRAKEAMKLFKAKEMYTDYKDMLEKSDVNAVVILTPISSHYQIAVDSARAGKHIYVQKAMTTTLQEANDLLSTVKEMGVKLVASPGQMHNPSLRMAKKMLDKGLIGKPLWGYTVTSSSGHLYEPTDPSWYYKPGGGPLYSFLVYYVTTFCWMLGSVRKVTAFSGIAIPTRWWKQKRINTEMDDSTMIIMDFGNSTFVSAISNFCTKEVMADSAIYGEKGVIKLPLAAYRSTQHSSTQVALYNIIRKIRSQVKLSLSKTKKWVEWTPPLFKAPRFLAAPSGAHIIADILEFVDCIIKDKEPTIATGKCARHVIEVFEKAYLSAKTGKTQQIQTTFD
jgi:predicted dehydrogenase